MKVRLLGEKITLRTVIPDTGGVPQVIVWDHYGKLKVFYRRNPSSNEWEEISSVTVRGGVLELEGREELAESRR